IPPGRSPAGRRRRRGKPQRASAPRRAATGPHPLRPRERGVPDAQRSAQIGSRPGARPPAGAGGAESRNERPHPDAQPPVRIRFDHVSVEFPTRNGPLTVVDDVSFDIRNGEFVSIIGPSGCGKTTMMSLVAGFAKPVRGSVLLDGEPVSGPGPERGVIFQEYGVFPWLTVQQNIA